MWRNAAVIRVTFLRDPGAPASGYRTQRGSVPPEGWVKEHNALQRGSHTSRSSPCVGSPWTTRIRSPGRVSRVSPPTSALWSATSGSCLILRLISLGNGLKTAPLSVRAGRAALMLREESMKRGDHWATGKVVKSFLSVGAERRQRVRHHG